MNDAVTCPVCFRRIPWPTGGEYLTWSGLEGRYKHSQLPETAVDAARMRRHAHVLCPNPAGDVRSHYLPATYGDFDTPLIVGLVGEAAAGKTSLLAAMVHEMLTDALHPLGIDVLLLDPVAHQRFQSRFLEPFLSGRRTPSTEPGRCEYAECLLVTSPTGRRPVVFVDAAGGDLDLSRPLGESVRFLGDADALLFVDSADYRGDRASVGNSAFMLAMREVGDPHRFHEVPVAVALTKTDRLRYRHPVDRWFRTAQDARTGLDVATFAAETEDVYAHLHARGAASSVAPFQRFSRCTMHFVSASGHDGFALPDEPSTLLTARPWGVLRPLVAILAMTGVLPGEDAARVGR